MAERRMISLEIVDTDAFLDMPVSAQLLYFHLNSRADDDGFVANPKKIMRMLGSQQDDFKVLIAKKFIIVFNDGICVIKHWRINNFIRKDIYKETKYLDIKRTLFIRANGAYTQTDNERAMALPSGHFSLDSVNESLTERQLRLGKVRLGKVRLGKSEEILPKRNKKREKEENTSFIEFWKNYPNKANKQSALKSWNKLKPDKNLIDLIVSSLKKHKASRQWIDEGGKYIPHASTWLNQRRWEDELTEYKTYKSYV